MGDSQSHPVTGLYNPFPTLSLHRSATPRISTLGEAHHPQVDTAPRLCQDWDTEERAVLEFDQGRHSRCQGARRRCARCAKTGTRSSRHRCQRAQTGYYYRLPRRDLSQGLHRAGGKTACSPEGVIISTGRSFLTLTQSYPSPLNYNHFPKSICTSPNEVICHGIPDQRVLLDGDIINLDVSLYHGGYHADLNATYYVGDRAKADPDAVRLVETTGECLDMAIKLVKPGTPIRGSEMSSRSTPSPETAPSSRLGAAMGPTAYFMRPRSCRIMRRTKQ